jgi:hypothetical protein
MMLLVVVGLVLLGLVLGVAFYLLGVYGRVGLIKGTELAEAREMPLSFSEVHQAVMPFYWRAVGLNLIFALALFLTALAFFGVMFIGSVVTLGLLSLCMIPLLCLMVPLGLIIGVFVEQANTALVLEDLPVMDAFRRSYEVIRANLGSYALMGLLLVLGGGFVGMVLALPFMLALVPIVTAAVAGMDVMSGVGISLLCGVLYLPVLLVLNGILRAFIGSSWTLTYMDRTAAVSVEVTT